MYIVVLDKIKAVELVLQLALHRDMVLHMLALL
jgi:hypothetical protein